jgi:hypothetical protein
MKGEIHQPGQHQPSCSIEALFWQKAPGGRADGVDASFLDVHIGYLIDTMSRIDQAPPHEGEWGHAVDPGSEAFF